MNEYGVDDSPLWFRFSEDAGMADARALMLSENLRRELREWNEEYERDWEDGHFSTSPESGFAHRVRSFELASQVQEQLGEARDVWCAGGGGVDGPFDQPSATVVLSANRPDTSLELWTAATPTLQAVSDIGGSSQTAKTIRGWRGLTERSGSPFGDARSRSIGLGVAGALQSDLGGEFVVAFFAGARTPAEYAALARGARRG